MSCTLHLLACHWKTIQVWANPWNHLPPSAPKCSDTSSTYGSYGKSHPGYSAPRLQQWGHYQKTTRGSWPNVRRHCYACRGDRWEWMVPNGWLILGDSQRNCDDKTCKYLQRQNFPVIGWWMLTNIFSSAWPAEKSVHHLAVLLQQARRQSQAQIQQRWHAYGDVSPPTTGWRYDQWMSVKQSETEPFQGQDQPGFLRPRKIRNVAWNLTNRLQEGLHCFASRTSARSHLSLQFHWLLFPIRQGFPNGSPANHRYFVYLYMYIYIYIYVHTYIYIYGKTAESLLENTLGFRFDFSAHTLPWMSTIALTRSGRSKANCKPTLVQMAISADEKPAILHKPWVSEAKLYEPNPEREINKHASKWSRLI